MGAHRSRSEFPRARRRFHLRSCEDRSTVIPVRAWPDAGGSWKAEIRALRSDSRERRLARIDAAARAGCTGVHLVGSGPGGATLTGAAHVDLASRACELGLLYGVVPQGPRQVSLAEPWTDYFLLASDDPHLGELADAVGRTGKRVWLRVDGGRPDDALAVVDRLVEGGCRRLVVVAAAGGRQVDVDAVERLRRDTGLDVGWSDDVAHAGRVVRAYRHFGVRHLAVRVELEGEGREGTGFDPSQLAALRRELGESTSIDTARLLEA